MTQKRPKGEYRRVARPVVKVLLDLLGMQHADAAEYLGVSVPTVRLWSRNAVDTPRYAVRELYVLWLHVSGQMSSSDFGIPDGGAQETREWLEKLAAMKAAGDLDEQDDDRPRRGRPPKGEPTAERVRQPWDLH